MKKIAFLGIPGSFSFIAAKKYFGNDVSLTGQKTVKNVFSTLIQRQTQLGVVPIENSTTGSILETYDQLMENNLQICGEVRLKIHHNLLVLEKNVNLKDVFKCYSHPQGIIQCQKFFENHTWIEPETVGDTATAAQMLASLKSRNAIAIASGQTAKIYGLQVLTKNIEDNKNNFTRFAVIRLEKNQSGNKATIAFSVKHIPGSLFKAIKPYADLGLNLTKIESRPIFGKSWEYIFFIDFEIGTDLTKFMEMIKRMRKVTDTVTILGLYDKGKIYET
ncbi:prephenate dehydratase [Candidatus Gottesmanbacteria bacterium]|nr:prephenate dehydratase [Candidatus Gottesmanbacteria bacterium]